ncbi:MAG TPA: transposase [Parvularculaceae bacterium]|nr:transposase [Parvularculaceae bacterium]
MPDYRRLYVPGGTYFFTVNLFDRRTSLLTDHIDALRASWRDMRARHPFETIAAAVLPDHFHCVWRLPDGDHDFSNRLSLLKAGFTRRLPADAKKRGRKRERNIWQRRFWEHAIRDDLDLERCVNYVHFNPVKHGYASDPDQWPFSTWRDWKKEYGAINL